MSEGKTTLALLRSDASASAGRAQRSALTQRQGPVPSSPWGEVQGGAGRMLKDTCLLSATEDKRSRTMVCQLGLVCYGSMELPAVSPVPATRLRAIPYPPAPLSLSSPQRGEKKAAPLLSATREALSRISVLFFFLIMRQR